MPWLHPKSVLFVEQVEEVYALLRLGLGLRFGGRFLLGGSLTGGYGSVVAGNRGIEIFLQLGNDFLPPGLIVEFLLKEVFLLIGIEGVVDGLIGRFLVVGKLLRGNGSSCRVGDDHRRVIARSGPEQLWEDLVLLYWGEVQPLAHLPKPGEGILLNPWDAFGDVLALRRGQIPGGRAVVHDHVEFLHVGELFPGRTDGIAPTDRGSGGTPRRGGSDAARRESRVVLQLFSRCTLGIVPEGDGQGKGDSHQKEGDTEYEVTESHALRGVIIT